MAVVAAFDLETRQYDAVNAFANSPIEEAIYYKPLEGWSGRRPDGQNWHSGCQKFLPNGGRIIKRNFSIKNFLTHTNIQPWHRPLHLPHLPSLMMPIPSEKVDFFMPLIIARIMLPSKIFASKKISSLIEENIGSSNVNVLTMLLVDVDLVAADQKGEHSVDESDA
jgi:hypothetical protein